METVYAFMFCYHGVIFAAGFAAHWAWSNKIWRVRGVKLRYAGQQEYIQDEYEEGNRFQPPPQAAFNPHHQR